MRHSLLILTLICIHTAKAQSESFSISLSQSLPQNSLIPAISPFGLEFGYGFKNDVNSPLGFDISFGYQNYGCTDHGDFVTSHSIYSLGFGTTLDLISSEKFTVSVKGSVGLDRFVTRSYYGTNELGHAIYITGSIIRLLFEDEDDEDVDWEKPDPLVILQKFSSFTPSFSTALNLEWRFDDSNGIFIEAGYRYLPSIQLIEKDNVIIAGDDIQYLPTIAPLELINFKIGYVINF